jgi:hypothetical protein
MNLPVELVIKILEWLSELDLEIVAQCNGRMQRLVRTVLMDRYRRSGLDPGSGLDLGPSASASGHSIRELVDLIRPPDDQSPTQRQWIRNGQLDRSGVPAKIRYHPNRRISYEEWYHEGELHSVDGPAVIGYYANGQKIYEYWYHDGLLHRSDGPAYTRYYENGQKSCEGWYQAGVLVVQSTMGSTWKNEHGVRT